MKVFLSTLIISIFVAIGISYSQTPVMNEIFSRGSGENLDWIEIYNPLASSIDISGFKIYDSGGKDGTKPKKEFPSGTVIPANGFFVIVVDDTSASGFGLKSSGETVWLENGTGTVIDSVVFPAMAETQSFGRNPDGGSTLQLFNVITKGYSNVVVRLNEIFSRGTVSNLDWIELYNMTTDTIDLTGYKIYDSGGQSGSKPKKEISNGTLVIPNGYLVIVTDDTSASGFGLKSSGETVWLEDSNGVVIDTVIFPALDTNQSYAKIPNGDGVWNITTTITKGASNVLTDIEEYSASVTDYSLAQNYPNPFNPTTTINFDLRIDGKVSLKIYNILGEEVVTLLNQDMNVGSHKIKFDASNLGSGVYIYRIHIKGIDGSEFIKSQKMMLLK